MNNREEEKRADTMEQDNVNHPKHYSGYPAEIECIDITRHMSFTVGNAFKYVWRAGKKGDLDQEIEDLQKALWYLEDHRGIYEYKDYKPWITRAVFQLIKPDRSEPFEFSRWRILESLVKGMFDTAIGLIETRIAALELGRQENNGLNK